MLAGIILQCFDAVGWVTGTASSTAQTIH